MAPFRTISTSREAPLSGASSGSRQNRLDSLVPTLRTSSSRPALSTTIRDSVRSMPRRLVPRDNELSVVVATTVASSSGSLFSGTSREPFAPQDTDTNNISNESDYSDIINEDESSLSLSDLFELEETTIRFRRSRTRGSLASLLNVRDNDSDLLEDVLRSNSVYELHLNRSSNSDENVHEQSSDSTEGSSVTISDGEERGPSHSSTSVEEVRAHVDAGNVDQVESSPEVIILDDSSDEEDEQVIEVCMEECMWGGLFTHKECMWGAMHTSVLL